MNRLKLWLFALIVLALAALGLRWLALDLRRQAVEGIDRQLLAAQARVEAAASTLQAEVAAVAALAAQDGALAGALRAGAPAAQEPPAAPGKPRRPAPPPPTAASPEQLDAAVDQAAAAAVAAAQQALDGAAQPGREVLAASREGLGRRGGDPLALAFLQDAMDHKVRRGFAVLGGKVLAGAALPVGEQGALAVFAPVDAAWATAAVAGTGTTLILSAPGLKPIASGRLADAEALSRAAPKALSPGDAGSLGTVDVSPPGLRVELPPVRSFLGPLPGDRVLARPVAGVKDGRMILALATRPALAPLVKLEWYGAAALVLVLLLAVVFGFLVKPTEMLAPVPPALLEAARKIERGDFAARAPSMAGRVGTVAAALNKAAEAALAPPPAAPPSAVGALDSEFFARRPAAAAPPSSDPFAQSSRGPRAEPANEARAEEDTARLDGANLGGAAFEAAPVAAPPPPAPAVAPEPFPAPAPAPAPPPAQPGGTVPFMVAVPAAAPPAPPAPAAASAADEEQHWREVFRDFVRTRGECGESAEGLTYERFRQKLETNKAALVAKYGCRTVRFQVYVKEGKAALKATPVR